LPAIDPTIPDAAPSWPGQLPWQPPGSDALRQFQAGRDELYWAIGGEIHLQVAEPIQAEIRSADLGRARGEITTAVLDAHEGLLRLKVAAALAILDGRLDLNVEDWQLAAEIKRWSDAARDEVEQTLSRQAAEQERQASARLASRAIHTEKAMERRKIVDCARKVAARVWTEPERWTVSELRRSMRSWRDVLDEGLEHAVAEGWVVEAAEPGRGDSKRTVRTGERRPT